MELSEREAAGETFTPKELPAGLEARFGVRREDLLGAVTRGENYNTHAADMLGALADAGIEAPLTDEQFDGAIHSHHGS